MPSDYLLSIPVYNEEKYLSRVIEESKTFADNILIVDDGSTDRTPELLRRATGVSILTHKENCGYGKSLASAFEYASREGFDWLITMDCDEQHEPAQIPHFLEAMALDDADVVSGTRYLTGHNADSCAPPDRRKINQLITSRINHQLGLRITDAFCGFKAYRVACLTQLDITVPGYAMPMQFWVQAARAGLRIREIPVRLIYQDPTRHFGGILDDPHARLHHYLDVFEAELARGIDPARTTAPDCVACK